MEKMVCVSCGKSFSWSRQWYKERGLQVPPLTCPTCADLKQAKSAHHTVKDRECLQEFSCVDVSQAVSSLPFKIIDEQDGRKLHHPYRRATVKGSRFGASWSGRIDVFDQRQDPTNPLARVRVMRTEHEAGAKMQGKKVEGPNYPWYSVSYYEWEHSDTWEYVVLDEPQGGEATARLVFTTAIQKWNRDDRIGGDPIWQRRCSGSSRTGKHSGQAVLAIVDGEHPLTSTRVHDRGAFHKGDMLVLGRGSEAQVMALLAKKAAKPIEVSKEEFDGDH